MYNVAMVGFPGGWEVGLVVLLVAFLIFGKRVPDMITNLGKSIGEFRRGIREKPDNETT